MNFSGLGFAMAVCSFGAAIYYNVMISWSFTYLFASMQQVFPWARCHNHWNTETCRIYDLQCQSNSNISLDATLINLISWNASNSTHDKQTTSTGEYWK